MAGQYDDRISGLHHGEGSLGVRTPIHDRGMNGGPCRVSHGPSDFG